MSVEQCEAIVLRVYPWSETSCIATLFTREHGKIAALAKGARRPKSPFEAALDLLSICRVVFISKSSDSLDILTEAKLQRRFRMGSQDLLRLYCGYYVAELLDRFTEKGDKHSLLFDLAQDTLDRLEQEEFEPRALVLRFELQMLRCLGHLPSWDRCVHCGKTLLEEGNAELQRENEWVLFSAFSGGVLCKDCRSGARQILRISSVVQQQFIYFSQSNWRRVDVGAFPDEHGAIVRKLIMRYLTFLLDSPIKLETYLEELGR
ncbi:MAG: DNA repair protein RecO [Planctomycetota bacterium]